MLPRGAYTPADVRLALEADMLQTVAVLTIVALAVLFLARRAWQTMRASKAASAKGCGPDCGCG